jgi:DnaJ family protein B protein 4
MSDDFIIVTDCPSPDPPSTKHLSDQNGDMDRSMANSATLDVPPASTSYTSSEVSAYDNPEITRPDTATNVLPMENEEDEVEPEYTMVDGSTAAVTAPWSPTRPPEAAKIESKSHEEPKSKSRKRTDDGEHEERTLIPEFNCALARSFGVYKKWTYTIRLTLEELFRGKKLRFRVLRCKLDGKRKTVILDVDIPPGSCHGTQIIFKGAGHERKNGKRQNIQFILEEEKHEKFVRIKDDLVVDARLPWVESLKQEKGVVHVKGIDGVESRFEVDFVKDGDVTGTSEILGAGMPILGTDKRGKLVVRQVGIILMLGY